MTRENLVTGPSDTTLEKAKDVLHRSKVEKLLLVDGDMNLQGLITIKDINKLQEFPQANLDQQGRLRVGAAVGAVEDARERAAALVEQGVDMLVVDTAHGHSKNVADTVTWLKANHNVDVVAGNVATAAGGKFLADAGADAVPEGLFIGKAEPDCTGGSFLFTQRCRFERPATPGVRFQQAIQLAGRQNEMLAHVLPYTGEQEQGEMLTVYMRDPSVLESVFQRMMMDSPADPARHWLQDCPAVSGTLFFVPSLDVLTGLRMGGIRMNRFSATQQFK